MFCTQCGARLNDSARYCVACGKPTTPVLEDSRAQQDKPRPRKLRRIRAGKKIAGVCNGFAEYFDMDVMLMRLIWVGLLLVPPHLGLIGYIVSWAVLPKN